MVLYNFTSITQAKDTLHGFRTKSLNVLIYRAVMIPEPSVWINVISLIKVNTTTTMDCFTSRPVMSQYLGRGFKVGGASSLASRKCIYGGYIGIV